MSNSYNINMLESFFVRYERDANIIVFESKDNASKTSKSSKSSKESKASKEEFYVDLSDKGVVDTIAQALSQATNINNKNQKESNIGKSSSHIAQNSASQNGVTSLSIREIQTYLRSGMTESDILSRFVVDSERLTRYAKMIRHEKNKIINIFLQLPARSEEKGKEVDDVINEYFDFNGIDRRTVTWDAYQKVNQPWTIIVEYIRDEQREKAIWTLDQVDRALSEENDNARNITKYWTDIFNSSSPDRGESAKIVPQKKTPSREYQTTTTGLKLVKINDLVDKSFKNAKRDLDIDSSYSYEDVKNNSLPSVLSPVNESDNNVPDNDPTKIMTNVANKTLKPVDSEVKTDEFKTIDDMNVTGAFRKRIFNKKHPKVPSWDETMLPPSDKI